MSPTFLVDFVDTPALADLRACIADRLGAVADEVERWSERVCTGPYGEVADDGYLQAEVILSRLERMSYGWWLEHARDSVEELLSLLPCLVCDGLTEGGQAVCGECAAFGHLTAEAVQAGNARVWAALVGGEVR